MEILTLQLNKEDAGTRIDAWLAANLEDVTRSAAQRLIEEERVKELYMEGFRLHDLKRWGMGFERTPQSQTQSEGSSMRIEAGNPLFVWPIPNHEIVSPGSQIQPNESNR